jgi:hypothetical protein
MNAGQDILIENGDIVINTGSGDFADTDSKTALLQDILEEFNFTYFDDLDNPASGSLLGNSVNSGLDEDIVILVAEIEVARLLKGNSFIDEKSVEVSGTVRGKKTIITAAFQTKAGDGLEVKVEV